MKFLLELVGCCGSYSSETRRQPDDARLLVAEESRRRKHDRARGGGYDWRPSLASISEDASSAKKKINNVRQPAEGWRRSLRRKVVSASAWQGDRRRSSARDVHRRSQIANVIPAFAPAPFMF